MVKGWGIRFAEVEILVVALRIGDGLFGLRFSAQGHKDPRNPRIIDFLRGFVRRNATGNEQVHLSSAKTWVPEPARLK